MDSKVKYEFAPTSFTLKWD